MYVYLRSIDENEISFNATKELHESLNMKIKI